MMSSVLLCLCVALELRSTVLKRADQKLRLVVWCRRLYAV